MSAEITPEGSTPENTDTVAKQPADLPEGISEEAVLAHGTAEANRQKLVEQFLNRQMPKQATNMFIPPEKKHDTPKMPLPFPEEYTSGEEPELRP